MHGLFNSELYSDIDIVCANNDDRYKCHKLLLSQSDVLAKLFDSQLTFKVRHSIPVNSDTLVFHATMYSVGEIYAISGLKQLAKRRFQAARALNSRWTATAFHSGNGEYSDMTIRDSDGSSYQVHKNVVCWQSPFFANAMKDGRFKESFEKRIDLFEDKPAAIRAMLEYMYGGDYDEGARNSVVEIPQWLQLHVDVYVIADKYQVNQSGLAALACKRIDDLFSAHWMVMMEDFPALMDEIYTRTRDKDHLLRPLVVNIAARHYADLKDRSDFSAAVNDSFFEDAMDEREFKVRL
ncbi:hypothetical protein SLS55_007280 [Diplodia seriata]|uniref:BTB domain-containing protein n=1 Tax=Diplodia seriata TaxID=420778 RepID=A0ABR3CBT7_9PEZI